MRSDNLRAKKAKRKKTGIILLLFIIVLILSAVIFVLKDYSPFARSAKFVSMEHIKENTSEACAFVNNIAGLIQSGKITEAGIDYKSVFEGSVIMGDSITEGLKVYGFLKEDQVYCEIGGSVMNGSDIVRQAAMTKPKTASTNTTRKTRPALRQARKSTGWPAPSTGPRLRSWNTTSAPARCLVQRISAE